MTRTDPLCFRLERRVGVFVAEHHVLHPAERAVLMLSGGPDSMALFAIVAALERRLGLGLELLAVHVDYRARGAQSDRDRELVEGACAAAGVPLHVRRLEHPLRGAGFQARARDLRYRYAREVAAREGASAIVTGHNRDDQAETVLYRLAKYASPRGLAGMRPRDGDVARPLLCAGAAELRAYCAAAAIAFGDDASNASAAYARNVLRHEVMPRLEVLNPRLAETLAAAALQAAAEGDVLAAAVAQARRRVAVDPAPRRCRRRGRGGSRRGAVGPSRPRAARPRQGGARRGRPGRAPRRRGPARSGGAPRWRAPEPRPGPRGRPRGRAPHRPGGRAGSRLCSRGPVGGRARGGARRRSPRPVLRPPRAPLPAARPGLRPCGGPGRRGVRRPRGGPCAGRRAPPAPRRALRPGRAWAARPQRPVFWPPRECRLLSAGPPSCSTSTASPRGSASPVAAVARPAGLRSPSSWTKVQSVPCT